MRKKDLKAKVANKKQYDKVARDRAFRVGDQVLVHYSLGTPGTNQKLTSPWRGIFVIDWALGHDSYSLRKPSGRRKKVHAKRMKFFDPMSSHEDPEIKLSKEDNTDVAHLDEVLEEAHNQEAAQDESPSDGAAPPGHWPDSPGTNVSATSQCPSPAKLPPGIGVPLSHQLWLQAQLSPTNALHFESFEI